MRPRWAPRLGVAVALGLSAVVAALVSAGTSGSAARKPSRIAERVLYSASSPFNQRISRGAKVDRRSKRLIRSFRRVVAREEFVITWRKWTVPVYYADAATPRRSVRLTARWRAAKRISGVPIPSYARPDREDDGQLAIVDRSRGCEYDFWQARRRRGRWSASWGNSIRTDGNGIFPRGLSARGSGFALLAGLIWPQELRKGRIDHALIFSYAYNKAGGPVPPATESDGWSRRRNAIPEGARLQLDPNLNLGSLKLKPYERTIARALQEYGMINGDNSGGGANLYAVSSGSVRGNPYRGLLPKRTYVSIGGIPFSRLRVLKLGRQLGDPPSGLVSSGCGRLR